MKILSGLEPIADQYDSFIFDIWGVIHNGVQAYPGVERCLSELKAADKQILMLSNTPSRAKYMIAQLQSMGIEEHLFDHIVTSGESTYRALKAHEGQKIHCLGRDNNPNCLHGLDLQRVPSPKDADIALVCELARDSSVEDYLETLKIYLENGTPLICANPDKVVDVGGTLYTCAGAVADAYIAMDGTVSWHGKPHAAVYDWAFDLFGNPEKSRVLAVGDSIRTDVTGAVDYGIDVLWNAVGIHWDEVSDNNVLNEDKIKQALNGLSHSPTGILNGLNW
ncbi:MAG: TIGR01459 family HAD-type hydrolase [Alphaproteobacteria bacterium]|nr:MAG: TIGR01459 family HAD-type hydrolase [Alphaproteobacteria bacterium]